MIFSTKIPHLNNFPYSIKTKLFLDCDTAILGADEARFDEYDRDVAWEFSHVATPEQYREGRGAFLRGLLASGSIFHSEYFRDTLEAKARRNVQRALDKMRF